MNSLELSRKWINDSWFGKCDYTKDFTAKRSHAFINELFDFTNVGVDTKKGPRCIIKNDAINAAKNADKELPSEFPPELLNANDTGDLIVFATAKYPTIFRRKITPQETTAIIAIPMDVDTKEYGKLADAQNFMDYFNKKTNFENYPFVSRSGEGINSYLFIEISATDSCVFDEFSGTCVWTKPFNEQIKLFCKEMNDFGNILTIDAQSENIKIKQCEFKGLPGHMDCVDGKFENTKGTLGRIKTDIEPFQGLWDYIKPIKFAEIQKIKEDLLVKHGLTAKKAERKVITGSLAADFSSVANVETINKALEMLVIIPELLQFANCKHQVAITPLDYAVVLAALIHCFKTEKNLSVKNAEIAFRQFYAITGRQYHCSRFATIRNHLSQLGLLNWTDNTYVPPESFNVNNATGEIQALKRKCAMYQVHEEFVLLWDNQHTETKPLSTYSFTHLYPFDVPKISKLVSYIGELTEIPLPKAA